MIKGPARIVAIANGNYQKAAKLENAVSDAQALADLLEGKHGYEAVVVPDPDRTALWATKSAKLAKGSLKAGTLILSWTGHGEPGLHDTLSLLGTCDDEDELVTAGKLGEWAAETGAHQILMILDTCSSGGGVIDAAATFHSAREKAVSRKDTWFAVIAASLSDEPALQGALSGELRRLLSEGPRKPKWRLLWGRKRAYISGYDLIATLQKEWSEPRQRTEVLTDSMDAGDLIHNPLFEAGLPDEVVEHLLYAARGEKGELNYFSGRASELQRIVEWMRPRKPGLFVVSGPAGSGKSAIVGRIVSLSSQKERARILQAGPVQPALDPGENSVQAHLQLRGLTSEGAAAELLRRLVPNPEISSKGALYAVLGEVIRLNDAGTPAMIVVDGLDEATDYSEKIASELLKLLAEHCLLLVATREISRAGGESLVAQMGVPAERIELAYQSEGSEKAISEYVIKRLSGVSPLMDAGEVAQQILSGSETATSFLLARLVTSQLMEKPVDTSSEGWRAAMAVSVESALEKDLQSVVLTIAEKPHPTAARELMTALAFAYGSGFPLDDVWWVVATAISDSNTQYTRDNALDALQALSRHIVAGAEGDQPVYRIAHQRMIDYLMPESKQRDLQLDRIAQALFDFYNNLLDKGEDPEDNQYLWRFAWRHMAEVGETGIALLRRLHKRNAMFYSDLASGLALNADRALLGGSADLAVARQKEAVAIYRELNWPSALCESLGQLALTQLLQGDTEAALETSQEAADIAATLPDSAASRMMVASSLMSRALTLLRNGRYRGALLLSQKVSALAAQDSSDPASKHTQAWATVTAAKAALTLGDIEMSTSLCQEGLAIFDQVANDPDDLSPGQVDALATLAALNLLRARDPQTGPNGELLPLTGKASERLFAAFARANKKEALLAIDLYRGLVSAIRCRLFDAARGVDVSHLDVPSPDALVDLVGKVISETRPFAAEVPDAAFVLANALVLRSQLHSDDPTQPFNDLMEGIAVLRPLSEYPLMCGTLGEFIDLKNSALLEDSNQSVETLLQIIPEQQEAVACLRKGGAAFVTSLIDAVERLYVMCVLTGKKDLVDEALSDAVSTVRESLTVLPDGRSRLAALLTDQAAMNVEFPLLFLQMSKDALEQAMLVPEPQQDARLIAFCEINLASARRGMRDNAGVKDLIEDALNRLQSIEASAQDGQFLAIAYTTLSLLENNQGEHAAALEHAREARKCLEEFQALDTRGALAAMFAQQFTLVTLSEGVALNGLGDQGGKGSALVVSIVDEALAGAVSGKVSTNQAAGILNESGAGMWERAKAVLADSPDVFRELAVMRLWPPEETDKVVQQLSESLASAKDDSEVFQLRSIIRQYRSINLTLFEPAWVAQNGALPDWMKIDPSQFATFYTWREAGSLLNQRDYLESHPALLDPATDVVIAQLRPISSSVEALDFASEILANARRDGIQAAYAPWVAVDELRTWSESADPVTYLEEHPNLRRPEIAQRVTQILADDNDLGLNALAGLLLLAQREELPTARKATDDLNVGLELLQAAWKAKDVPRLGALAAVVAFAATNSKTEPSIARKALAAMAVAAVLEGKEAQAQTLMEHASQDADADDCSQIAAVLGEAIATHSSASSSLAKLFRLMPPARGQAAST